MDPRATLAWVAGVSAVVLLGCTSRDPGTEREVVEPSVWFVERSSGAPAQLPISELAEFEQPNAVLLAGRVYPLGWSRSGLFAYVYEPPDEACGCYVADIIVLDLHDNDIEWTEHYESSELHEDDPEQIADLDALWQLRGRAWSERLAELGIERQTSMKTLQEFGRPGHGLRVEIDTTEVGEDSSVGFAHIERYEIALVDGDAREVVFTSEESELGPLALETRGYFDAPGGYLAILLQETWRGWEGLPHVARLRFVGARRPAT